MAPDVAHFRATGWLRTSPFAADEVARIRGWVDEIQSWPDDASASGVLQYSEMTDLGPRRCRTENFLPAHDAFRALLTEGILVETAGALLGEPAVLYKEKINYKLAGGAGYAPHQDAPAYRFVATHVSCMIAVDDSSLANGCLEVVSGRHHELLPTDERGCIRTSSVEAMEWEPLEVRAGDVLWFHSLTPHRSGPNTSTVDRRAVYPTYNARREGDLRDAYYGQKLRELAAAGAAASTVKVSLIDDFQGRPV